MDRDGCTKFTYGDTLGCRVSGCNPSHMSMGAPECSGENDCPLADGYGGVEYNLNRDFVAPVEETTQGETTEETTEGTTQGEATQEEATQGEATQGEATQGET